MKNKKIFYIDILKIIIMLLLAILTAKAIIIYNNKVNNIGKAKNDCIKNATNEAEKYYCY